MALFNKVGIVGTGLVGGSLGLALKKNKIARIVVGTSRRRSSISAAIAMGAIDKGSTGLDILTGCDLIVLAAPVQTILDQIGRIKRLADGSCIVIDVASTKEEVVKKADGAFAKYVGCHPLAGSHKTGVSFARADLFRGGTCIVTPVKSTDKAALARISSMWKRLGMHVARLDPAAHDRALAYMSHLPHVMAFALMAATPDKYLSYAPQSFRDMTRIACSSPELWDDIFITNNRNLLASIDTLVDRITRIRCAVKRRDSRSLTRLLSGAQRKRLHSL